MKDEKKVNKVEEAKKEVQTEEEGVQLTDEELAQVNAGGDVLYTDEVGIPHTDTYRGNSAVGQ